MSVLLASVFVAGLPKTKGSLSPRGRGPGLKESVEGSSTWRALMAGALRDCYRHLWAQRTCTAERDASRQPIGCSHPPHMICGQPAPWPGPVDVIARFQLPVDPLQARAGDLDKLLRNVLDALASDAKNPRYNAGVIINDNQVIDISARKRGPLDHPGVNIEVYTVEARSLAARADEVAQRWHPV